jgi:hypothetical protein
MVLNSERRIQYLSALRQDKQFVIDTEEQHRGCGLQIANFESSFTYSVAPRRS